MRRKLRQVQQRLSSLPWMLAGFSGLYDGPSAPVQFVIENADWAIKWVGEHIRNEIDVISPGAVQTTISPQRCVDRVVHFGSQYMWLSWGHLLSKRNRYVTSFFHGKPADGPDVAKHIEEFLDSIPRLSCIVTAASIVEQRLLAWGVPREKLKRIPIGVDMDIFIPPNEEQRMRARERYGIPEHVVLVGSFQKDGIGWGEGMEPKLIKGPDIFVDTLAKLKAAGLPVVAFLTGPARGYIKRELERLSITSIHTYCQDHHELVSCYHALDLYLVTSREEGGPMSLMESMASGVPVVATRVGMAPDLIVNGVSGALADDFSGEEVARKALDLLALCPHALRDLRQQALDSVRVASWPEVGRSHWENVYQNLLIK